VVKDGKLLADGKEVIPIEETEEVLAAAYKDAALKAGRDRMYKRLKAKYVGISRRDVMKFLRRQEAHQLHQPVRKSRVLHRVIIAKRPFERWQADLIDMRRLKGYNNRDAWILTVIDLFSKYGWVRALKHKTAHAVARGMEDILTSIPGGKCPQILQTDNGKEFKNTEFQRVLSRKGIRHIFSQAYKPTTQGAVERFNRTLKEMIFSHMSQFQTKKWSDVLPLLVQNHNTAYNFATKFTPQELMDPEAPQHKLDAAYGHMTKRRQELLRKRKELVRTTYPNLAVDDSVRVSVFVMDEARSAKFRKRYMQNWSKQIYRVEKISQPDDQEWAEYRLQDQESGQLIRRRFYREDLQKIDPHSVMHNTRSSRPDYSQGKVFDLESHLEKIHHGKSDGDPDRKTVTTGKPTGERQRRPWKPTSVILNYHEQRGLLQQTDR
jgi:transposase InsO family protein